MNSSWKSFQNSAAAVASAAASTVQAGVSNVDFSATSSKLNKTFSQLSQTVKERTGGANLDITELPQEYLDLEARVDALKRAHLSVLRVTKVYDSESYDYPTQLQESVTELGGSLAHQVSFWAAAATKGTNLPQPTVSERPASVHKTLPHAMSRAAAGAAVDVGGGRLGDVLKSYAVAMDAVGEARITQDEAISTHFLQPWSATLNSSLQAAIKSRSVVKTSRIALDACRGTLKTISAGGNAIRLEQGRLDVEAAEEKLVNATEEAINLMRSVLDNPEPIKNIIALLQAQKAFYHEAASALGNVEAEMEEMGVAAEAEYRKSRAQ